MMATSADLPKESPRIKKNGKFSSWSLSREKSMDNSSLEFYHGDSPIAVPFLWESQPGTPKLKFHEAPLPPLTPPPSYFSNTTKKPIKDHSKHKLLHSVFPKLTFRKTHLLPSPASTPSSLSSPSSGSWSSSYSVPSSPVTPRFRGRVPSSRTSFDSRIDEEDDEYGSPVSTLCFSAARGLNVRKV
ncbi:hypothetical protein L1049_013600 [Liquidambar formosana]|uniref:Uncharacterized protein n=1 Tax=Liquidambar formosana TaxID=63359 RepID=A0AAP0RQF0_LIQFO